MARTALLTFDGIKGRFGCGVFLAVFSILMAGCASGSGPGTEPVRVGGAYAGRFLIESEPFESSLQLRTSGSGHVTGAFRVSHPVVIDGAVSGSIVGDLLRIRVSWTGANGCNGTIEGILSITEGGGVLDGPVTVADCATPVSGRMAFRRRER